MPPNASVVVVSYRPGDWLAPCLASAVAQSAQVVVVDNGSDDEEASAIARSMHAEVIRSSVNLGFAGGVDLGLHHARGEIIGLLNDDAVAGPEWIDAARDALADPTVAAVTPKVVLDGVFGEVILDDEPWHAPGDARPLGRQLHSVTLDAVEVLEDVRGTGVYDPEHAIIDHVPARWRWTSGRRPFYVPLTDTGHGGDLRVNGEPTPIGTTCRLVNHAGSYLEGHGVAGEYGLGAPDDGRFDHGAERFGFSGTAPVFRAETLHRIGAFAPQFFAYNEDTDWCLRARLAGLRILYDSTAEVRHRLSATSQGPRSPMVRFLAQRNALLCLVRNAPPEVARHLLWQRLHDDPDPGLRRAVLAKLPWALASRARLRRLWTTTPRAIWDRWAGADRTWDDGPAAST
ncbi:MAG TPA: glycosyltransferase family 2 protein [Acidimicrobiales bacterium]|nr:glycosyltransferase family 2 protein [Acidimicrobiales bacterium]